MNDMTKTAAELLQDLHAALAHHEAEAARHAKEAETLRRMVAASEGASATSPAAASQAPSAEPLHGPNCQCALCIALRTMPWPASPQWPAPYPQPAVPLEPPFIWTAGHGGPCACEQCCPRTWCGTMTTTGSGVSALLDAGCKVDINCAPAPWMPSAMTVWPDLGVVEPGPSLPRDAFYR